MLEGRSLVDERAKRRGEERRGEERRGEFNAKAQGRRKGAKKGTEERIIQNF
ncbi:MAG: hypothetical protein ABI134_32670 [Byssovorax sp.]